MFRSWDGIHSQTGRVFIMARCALRSWDSDDSERDNKIVRFGPGALLTDEESKEAQDFLKDIVRGVKGDEMMLRNIYSYIFQAVFKCDGCHDIYGFRLKSHIYDIELWAESLYFKSKINRLHFIPYLEAHSNARLMLNYFCDSCYDRIFGNAVSLFQDCAWRDTILFRCSTVDHISDQWVFHTGGDIVGDGISSYEHFKAHITDPDEPGFVAFRMRHYDSVAHGSFRKHLMKKRIYSSECDVTAKVYVDKFYINYRQEGEAFGFWVEKAIAVELFGLVRMEGTGVWSEGGRSFLYKNSVIYAHTAAYIVGTMYPDIRRDVYRRMAIEEDGRVSVIRTDGTAEIELQVPAIPVDDLKTFGQLVIFLVRMLSQVGWGR